MPQRATAGPADARASPERARSPLPAVVTLTQLNGSPVVVLDALETSESRGFPYLGNTPSVRWHGDASRAAMEDLLGVVLRETLRFRHFPTRVAHLCRAYAISGHERVLPAPPELLTVLRARSAAAAAGSRLRLVYPDPPLGTDELALGSGAMHPLRELDLRIPQDVGCAAIRSRLSVDGD